MSARRNPDPVHEVRLKARAVSQSTLVGVVPLTVVANWFRVRRPRAMGFATALIDPARPPEPDFGDRVVASLEELRCIRQ